MNTNAALTASSSRRAFLRRVKKFLLIGIAMSAVVLLIASTLPHVKAWAFVDELKTPSERIELSRWSDDPSVRLAGGRIPEINLGDGRAVLASYVGDENLRLMFERNEARPLSLASADFDEDGVPDLVGGYDVNGGGALTLYRGNVDTIYPNSPEAQQRKADGTFTDTPFLSPARIFAVRDAPDFLGAGDFDADGHWDVVTAARGESVLRWLPGDGRGGFGEVREVALPGGVTTMTTGEINRADGLIDVVVGVEASQGAQALVFEGPEGALKADPEMFALPAAASAMALGQLDDEYTIDLAVAAGKNLIIVQGRDRMLSLDEERQATVKAASIARRSFPSVIRSLAIGNFTAGRQSDIALLSEGGGVQVLSRRKTASKKPIAVRGAAAWQERTVAAEVWAGATQLVRAKVSSLPGDDLLILDDDNRQVHITNANPLPTAEVKDGSSTEAVKSPPHQMSLTIEGGAPVAALPLRLDADAFSDLIIFRSGESAPVIAQTTQNEVGSSDRVFARTASETGGNTSESGTSIIRLEAEAGTLVAPMTISSDPLANEGKFISSATRDSGTASYSIDVTTAGRYVVWTRVLAKNFNSDSFFVSVDGGAEDIYDVAEGRQSNAWQWRRVNGRAGGAPETLNPRVFDLTQGTHTFLFRAREIDTRLDSLVFTNDPNFDPNRNFTPQIFIVNSIADTDVCDPAHCTLRGAINAANTSPNTSMGTQTIRFDIPGSGVQTIKPTSALPTITDPVTIDGTTQRGFAGFPLIELNGANADFGGLHITAGNSTVRGLIINGFGKEGIGFGKEGIRLENGGGNIIEGNYIGTNAEGAVARGNNNGVTIFDSPNNIIGGSTPNARNVISGNNESGISIEGRNLNQNPSQSTASTGNKIIGNRIGTDVTGSSSLGRQTGITVTQSPSNEIGGSGGARNVISGNGGSGVLIRGDKSVACKVEGNYIGIDATGTNAVGNGGFSGNGVHIVKSSSNNIVGNIISGNFTGVLIEETDDPQDLQRENLTFAHSNQVQGNFVGTDADGMKALGNGTGVLIDGRNSNFVGGTASSARNIIAGNAGFGAGFGVFIALSKSGCAVQGNFIGINANGDALGNSRTGIYIYNADNNRIGGSTVGARNIISSNGGSGIIIYGGAASDRRGEPFLDDSKNNRVEGNFIGTDVTGSFAMGNAVSGVALSLLNTAENSTNNMVGGPTAEQGNVISGNRSGVDVGISLDDPLTRGVLRDRGGKGITVQNNHIGTDVNGDNCLRNTTNGVLFDVGTAKNSIQGNRIACNGANGVSIPENQNPGVQIALDDNNIYGNDRLGIDLGMPGVTPNDLGDDDGGANLQQNFPVLSLAPPSGNSGGGTFSNPSAIDIPDSGAATPYPSDISVSGLNGTVSKVSVTLKNIRHTFPDDLDILLVAPTGERVMLMSDAGGDFDLNNVTLTLDDGATRSMPDGTEPPPANQITSGTYRPTNYNSETTDEFPPPAPEGLSGSSLSVFNGINDPNGTWSLYVVDDASFDAGIITGGWSLTIEVTPGPSSATSNIVSDTRLRADDKTPVQPSGAITVNGRLNSKPNTAYIVHWYFSAASQCTNNQPPTSLLHVGRVANVQTDSNGNAPFNFPFAFPAGVTSGVINCTATDPGGNTSEYSECLSVSDAAPPAPATINGRVAYGSAGTTGVRNVTVTLSGSASFTPRTTQTNANGDYSFPDVPSNGEYTITPSKIGDVNNIGNADATLVRRHNVNMITLNSLQQLAADASNNGTLSGTDASLILRFSVLNPDFGIVGTWKFVTPSLTITATPGMNANKNFSAVLVGDVSGNWTPPASNLTSGEIASVGSSRAALPAGSTVSVSLPMIAARRNSPVTIPITVGDLTGGGVTGYDADIRFDPNVLQLRSPPISTAGTLSSSYLVEANSPAAGRLLISASGTQDLSGSGTLLNLQFTVIGQVGQTSPLTFQSFQFNEGNPPDQTMDGQLRVEAPTADNITIAGTVRDARGRSLAGVTTQLTGSEQMTTVTDGEGRYVFTVPAGGTYQVQVRRRGFTFNPPMHNFNGIADNQIADFTEVSRKMRAFQQRLR